MTRHRYVFTILVHVALLGSLINNYVPVNGDPHFLGDKANPVGLTIGTRGEVTHAHRLIPQQRGKTSVITAAKIRQEDIRIEFLSVFRSLI